MTTDIGRRMQRAERLAPQARDMRRLELCRHRRRSTDCRNERRGQCCCCPADFDHGDTTRVPHLQTLSLGGPIVNYSPGCPGKQTKAALPTLPGPAAGRALTHPNISQSVGTLFHERRRASICRFPDVYAVPPGTLPRGVPVSSRQRLAEPGVPSVTTAANEPSP